MLGTLLSICFAFLIFNGPASSEIKLGSIFENPSVLNDMGDGLHEWMRWLDDGLRINKISIPGTHDSMADRKFCNKLIFDFKDNMSVAAQEEILNFWGLKTGITCDLMDLTGANFIQTQDLTLEYQLRHGIRFLDIRLRNTGHGFFNVNHGPVVLDYTFEDVLETVKNFLIANPTETVIISYQAEWVRGTSDFNSVFAGRVEKYKDYIYGGTNKNVYRRQFPTVRQVRKKIVFYNKQNSGNFGFWKDTADIEDWFENVNVETDNYYDACENHIKKSMAQNEEKFYTTYLSANNGAGGRAPRAVAWYVNSVMEYRLTELKERAGPFGIVVMDFPSIELIRTILRKNDMGIIVSLLDRVLMPEQNIENKICAIVKNSKTNYITLQARQYQKRVPHSDPLMFKYVYVQKSCVLTIYSEKNYQGSKQEIDSDGSNWLSSSHWLGYWWQNDVQSYKCHCATYGRFNIRN